MRLIVFVEFLIFLVFFVKTEELDEKKLTCSGFGQLCGQGHPNCCRGYRAHQDILYLSSQDNCILLVLYPLCLFQYQ